MHISVSEAKAHLTDLVKRAEAGDEIILTRHGQPAVRLVPVGAALTSEEKGRIIARIQAKRRQSALQASFQMAPAQPAARISSTAQTVYPIDRRRYLGLIAILQMEARSAECAAALQAETHVLLSAGTMAEALIVTGQRNLTEQLTSLIDEIGIEIVPVTEAIAYRVAEAYARWGKGNHPARLNLGDCFAYAVAKEHGCSLLYVGDDFSQTDVAGVL